MSLLDLNIRLTHQQRAMLADIADGRPLQIVAQELLIAILDDDAKAHGVVHPESNVVDLRRFL